LLIVLCLFACAFNAIANTVSRRNGPAGTELMDNARCSNRFDRFLVGVFILGLVALGISEQIAQPFWLVLIAVLCFAVASCALAIWWLALWATQKDARPGQFGIGSLLFLAAFVAIYCGAVRWIVTLMPSSTPASESRDFCSVAVIMLIVAVVSVGPVFCLSDGLLWAAVWLVKRPGVRRLLMRRGENR
jgi:uncharacterized membrane protein